MVAASGLLLLSVKRNAQQFGIEVLLAITIYPTIILYEILGWIYLLFSFIIFFCRFLLQISNI
jgi:hypothetical protein